MQKYLLLLLPTILCYFLGADKCHPLKPPVNGAVSYITENKLAQMACKSGYYPEQKVVFLYICVNNVWKDPSPFDPAPVPLPDCLGIHAHYLGGFFRKIILVSYCTAFPKFNQTQTRF